MFCSSSVLILVKMSKVFPVLLVLWVILGRKVRPGHESQENQTFFCNYCGVNICRRSGGRGRSEAQILIFMFRCDCVYHTGMTCQFYQIYKSDNDHSLRVSRVQSGHPRLKIYVNKIALGLAAGRSFQQKTLP